MCTPYVRGVGVCASVGGGVKAPEHGQTHAEIRGCVLLPVDNCHAVTYKLGVFYDPINETAVFFIDDALFEYCGTELDRSRGWRFVMSSKTPAEVRVNATAMLPPSAVKYFKAIDRIRNGDGAVDGDDTEPVSTCGDV